jgi:glutamate--cysteine ligase
MQDRSVVSEPDLWLPFRRPGGYCPELIGIEVECGLVEPGTGLSVGYRGEPGARMLLEAVLKNGIGQPLDERGNLTGIALGGGAQISLEPGGAIEYASAPGASIESAVAAAKSCLESIAGIAREIGIALLPGGLLPFTKVANIPWIPKTRIGVMRGYFAKLGDRASQAEAVMGLTLSTQSTLDYVSEPDLAAKFAMFVAATPVVAALFVNSPLEEGQLTGAASRRMQLWRKIDPVRCQALPFGGNGHSDGAWRLDGYGGLRISDLIEWVSSLPMIYRSSHGIHVPAPQKAFRDLLGSGFDDGAPVTQADWYSQLSQVWPYVRVRRTIELRVTDGPPWPAFGAVPALWAGLAYHPPSLRAAWELVRDMSLPQIEAATEDVAARGLAAAYGPHRVGELAREFVDLAYRGLEARVAKGQESTEVLSLLDPVDAVVSSGITFSQRAATSWEKDFAETPARYVSAYRL